MVRDEPTNDSLASMQVKMAGRNSRMPLCPESSHSNLSFGRMSSDLERAPPTLLKQLPDKMEVKKRLDTEEVGINSAMRMRELQDLNDVVFAKRTERLHW